MKKKYLIITLAAVVAVSGFTLLNARAAASGGAGRFHGAIKQRIAEHLKIADSQKAQIKAELKSEKDALTKLFTQLHDMRKDLREAVRAKDATEVSVRAAAAKVAAVESDLAVERLKLYGKIAPILTADQLARLAEVEAKIDDFISDAIGRIGERLAE